MFAELFWGLIIVILTGLAFKAVLYWLQSEYHITWLEYGITLAVFLCAALPLISWGFNAAAFKQLVSYEENWNGYEVNAQWVHIKCSEDGPCVHCYDCDPYEVPEDYECGGYEGEGKDEHYVSKTCTRMVTKYHSCPYTDEEWTFIVHTTLGDYTIAANNLPTNPDQHRWDRFERVPSNYDSGVPVFWQQAYNRVAANQPGPVTERHGYDNFILASQHTILKKYSADIQRYQRQGLLPKLDTKVTDVYFENRVYFVGAHPQGDWVRPSNYFNGALGLDLEGDLHVVIVDANKVEDPDTYTGALTAYWQSPALGKQALSKNGIVVVLGTKDGKTVDWSRGATGMPQGNEAMLIDMRDNLAGKSLDPATIFGNPTGDLYQDGGQTKVRINHTHGALEDIIWGAHKFHRIGMREYQYLKHEIKPTDSQMIWLYVIVLITSCIAWGICIAVGPQTYHNLRPYYRREN